MTAALSVGLTVGVTVGLAAAAARWIGRHPWSVSWDEAHYLERVHLDAQCLAADGLGGFARALLGADRRRPPAYRLLVAPFLLVGGIGVRRARLATLACYPATVALVLVAVGRPAGWAAGGTAAALVAVSPMALGACMRFYADAPLYVGIAGTTWFLGELMATDAPPWWAGLGLAGALVVGGLAKTSFVLVAGPMVAAAVGLTAAGRFSEGRLVDFALPLVGAALVLAPWWGRNGRPALRYGRYSSEFSRHSMDAPAGLVRAAAWARTLGRSVLGQGAAAVTALVWVAWVTVWVTDGQPNSDVELAVMFSAMAGVPALPLGALRSSNHNPRLAGPAVVPLAVATGLAARGLPASLDPAMGVAAAVLVMQALVILRSASRDPAYDRGCATARGGLWPGPAGALLPVEQWDWSGLRDLCVRAGLTAPSIAYLGNAEGMSPPQIRFPWVVGGTVPEVHWLWRYEDGPIDWEVVRSRAATAAVVVTVPGIIGHVPDRHDEDNRHSAEFASLLAASDEFVEVGRLGVGRFERTSVRVFSPARSRAGSRPDSSRPHSSRTDRRRTWTSA
jgi:hypothetical protein